MANGLSRFNFYLDQLEQLLKDASAQPDPALYLYKNGARTPLFMLEGLSKLYGGLHNKKRFGKMEQHFKLLEDGLGSIDYYDAFAEDFATDPAVSPDISKLVREKCVGSIASLNEVLKDKKWLGDKPTRLAKIKRKVKKTDWPDGIREVEAIEKYYRRSIGKINEFGARFETGFTELEPQVHELRRKLRWLSIYPQALQGLIQLTAEPSGDPEVFKYLTPEIVNSPFNNMPEAGDNRLVLTFNRDYFLALSWMIAELGKLKDEGLRHFVVDEVVAEPQTKPATTEDILSRASDITRSFFAEQNLDKLIVGITASAPAETVAT
jgi:hypothetical protein